MRIDTRLSPPFLFSVRARGEPGNEARGCHAQHIYGATALTSGHVMVWKAIMAVELTDLK